MGVWKLKIKLLWFSMIKLQVHAYVHSPRIQLNPHISLSQAKKWGQKNCLSIPKLLSHQKPIRGYTGFHE